MQNPSKETKSNKPKIDGDTLLNLMEFLYKKDEEIYKERWSCDKYIVKFSGYLIYANWCHHVDCKVLSYRKVQ